MEGHVLLSLATAFSAYFLYAGFKSYRQREVSMPFVVNSIPVGWMKYKGDESVGPAIVLLYLGMVFPLMVLSVLFSKLTGIEWSLGIFLVLPLFIVVGWILSQRNNGALRVWLFFFSIALCFGVAAVLIDQFGLNVVEVFIPVVALVTLLFLRMKKKN